VLTPRSSRSLLTLLFLVGVARPGWADDPRGSARAHYARGLELASQNGYEAALREFNEAYAISPQFAVLYNIGQAHVALGHSLEAIEVLSRYLRDGQDRLPPGRREQVQAQLAHLSADLASASPASTPEAEQARAAAAASARAAAGVADAAVELGARPLARTGTLSIRCTEPGLKILLDGQNVDPASATRGLPVAAGAHRLALAALGRRAPEQSVDVPAGATAIVVCQNLPPAPAEHPRVSIDGAPVFTNVSIDGPPVFSNAITHSGPPASPSVVEHPKPPGVRASTVGFALGGVGVVLGGAAVGVYLWNRGQYDKAQMALGDLNLLKHDHPHADSYEPSLTYNARVDPIHLANYVTVGLAVASVAFLAGGIYLWRRDPRRGDKPGALVARRSWGEISPGGISWNSVW
jgi:hypothetical protein